MSEWLLIIYKLPATPSRYRAAVWRKLKGAGAIYLQDSVAALPADAAAERVLRGLVAEIDEAHGTAYLLRGAPLGDEQRLSAAYNAAREAEYAELLGRCSDLRAELADEREAGNFTFAELEENEDDLRKLEVWLGKIEARDRFVVPVRLTAVHAIAACREDLDEFAAQVYATADHGSAGHEAAQGGGTK